MFQDEVEWTRMVDVYPFGVNLYEILVGSSVFREDDAPNDILLKKRSSECPLIGPTVLPCTDDRIRSCWQSVSDRRPSFADIFGIFESVDFAIRPDTDWKTLADYANGITDYELGPPCGPSLQAVLAPSTGNIQPSQK
jgi:hypothetical protein